MDYLTDNYERQDLATILLLCCKEESDGIKAEFGFISMGLPLCERTLYDSVGTKLYRVVLPRLAVRLKKDVVTTLDDVVFPIVEKY